MFDDTTSSVIESFPGAVFAVTRDGRVAVGNDRCSVLFGRDFDELVGEHVQDLVAEGLLSERTFERYQDAAASLTASGSTEEVFTARARLAGEGAWYPYEATVTPFEEADETRGFVWSLTDLGTSERYDETVEALHEATQDLIRTQSTTEAYERCGEAANEVLGFPGTGVRKYDPEEGVLRHVTFGGRVDDIEERPPYDVDDSPHGRAFQRGETVIDQIEDDDPFDREAFAYTMYVPIGEFGVLSLGKFGDRFDDPDRRFAEILAENTAAAIQQARQREQLQRKREELERQNERLDEFASVVAHDLRNPLSLGRGAFELYREAGDDEHAADVEYAFERMETIIEEVLTLAREGEDVDDAEEIAIEPVAREAWGMTSARAASLEVHDPGRVVADRDRLLQVFENLFRNALEHGRPAEQGRERVGSQAASEKEEGASEDEEEGDSSDEDESTDLAAITVQVGALADAPGFYVADDGLGIDPVDRDRVFEAGYSTSESGTGLGLGIVSRIARAHGWEADVCVSSAGGARFEFFVE